MYCVRCKEKKIINPSDVTLDVAKNGRPMMRAICPTCGAKMTMFSKRTNGSPITSPLSKRTKCVCSPVAKGKTLANRAKKRGVVAKGKTLASRAKGEVRGEPSVLFGTDMTGEGLFDWVKNAWDALVNGYREDFSPSIRKIIDQIGTMKITAISLARVPIATVLQTVLGLLTGGNSEKIRKELNYDDLYHLGLILTLSDGQMYKLEKNEIPMLTHITGMGNDELLRIPVPAGGIEFNEFIGKALKKVGKAKYFVYNVSVDNCQAFTMYHLEANDLDRSDKVYDFVMQDATKILADEKVIGLAKLATDAAHFASLILEGRGRAKGQKRLLIRGSGVKALGPAIHWRTMYKILTSLNRGT